MSGWGYRKSHIINFAAGAGTLYQKQITVHYGAGVDGDDDIYCNSHCKTDFGDIRFTDDDGSTEIDYWLDPSSKVDGVSAEFWVEVVDSLESAAQTIYIYYGNAGVSTTSNGDNAFLAFCHYDGSEVPPTGWTLTLIGTKQFSEDQANSFFRLYSFTSTSAAWTGRYLSKSISEITSGFKAKAKLSTNVKTAVAGQGVVVLDLLTDTTLRFKIGYGDYWISVYGSRTSSITGTDGSSAANTEDGAISAVVEIEKAGTTVKTYYNGAQQQTKNSVSETFNKIQFDLRGAAYVTNQEAKVDYFYIRKFVDPEPTHGDWGSEEEEPTGEAHYKTITEYLGGLDSYSRADKEIHRTRTDYIGGLDTKTRTKQIHRTITELLGLLSLNDWKYRKAHTIKTAVGAGTDYQVKITALYDTSIEKIIPHLEMVSELPLPSGRTLVSGQCAVYWDGTYLHVWYGATTDGGSVNDDIFYTKTSAPFTSWDTPIEVISAETGEGMRDPTIFEEGNYLYFFCQCYNIVDDAYFPIRLYKISKTDNFTQSGNYTNVGIVVNRGGFESYDEVWVASPCVRKIGSTYYLMYEARDSGGVHTIGRAKTTNIETLPWTKDDLLRDTNGNPIVNPDGNTNYIVPDTFADDDTLFIHWIRAGAGEISIRYIYGDFPNNSCTLSSSDIDPLDGYFLHFGIANIGYIEGIYYCTMARMNDVQSIGLYSSRACALIGNKCETDFSDIIFTNEDETLLKQALAGKVNSEYASFWVKISDDLSLGDVTIYIYYGNPNATLLNDWKQTSKWNQGDDFDDNLRDENMWDEGHSATGGEAEETNQRLEFICDSAGEEAWFVSHAIKAMANFEISAFCSNHNLAQVTIWLLPEKVTDSELYNRDDWYRIMIYNDEYKCYVQRKKDGVVTTLYSGVWLAAFENTIKIAKSNGTIKFFERDLERYSETWDLDATSCYIYLEGRAGSTSVGTDYADSFFARKLVDPPPKQDSWGEEEEVKFQYRTKSIHRVATELFGLLDVKSRVKSIHRTITELLGELDTRSRVKSIHRSITELLGTLDAHSRVKLIHRIITELLELLDTKSPILIDSYEGPETFYATINALFDEANSAWGQAFTTLSCTYKLTSAQFRAKIVSGTPTGHLQALLYEITGTYGVDAIPTGSPLAHSDLFDIAGLTSSPQWIILTFSGIQQYAMESSHHYAIVIVAVDGNLESEITEIGVGAVSVSGHDGNISEIYPTKGAWFAEATMDLVFKVYGKGEGITRIKSIYRTITELLGTLDTKSRIKSIYRTVTESLGLKDTKSKLRKFYKTIIELLGFKDTKSRIKGIHRTKTERLGLKDTRNRTKSIHRIVAEKLGSIDLIAMEIIHGKAEVVGKRISEEIEFLTGIKIPITFSRQYNILSLLSDLSSAQLQELLEAKSDYAKAVMLDLFKIDLPISYRKIDELIIKLTSSLIYHRDERLLQILINLISLREIMNFLDDVYD